MLRLLLLLLVDAPVRRGGPAVATAAPISSSAVEAIIPHAVAAAPHAREPIPNVNIGFQVDLSIGIVDTQTESVFILHDKKKDRSVVLGDWGMKFMLTGWRVRVGKIEG